MADHRMSDPSYFQGTSFTMASNTMLNQPNYTWPNPAIPTQSLHYPKPIHPGPMYPLSSPFPPGSFNSPLQMSHILSNSPLPPLPPPPPGFLVPEYPYLMSSQPLPHPSSFMQVPPPPFTHPGLFRFPNQSEPFQHQFSSHNNRQSRFSNHHGRHKSFSDTFSERYYRTNKQSDTTSVASFRSLDERLRYSSDTSSERSSRDSNSDPDVNSLPEACRTEDSQETTSSNKTNNESADCRLEDKSKESNSEDLKIPIKPPNQCTTKPNQVMSIIPVFPKRYWSDEDIRTSVQLEENLLNKFEHHTLRVLYPDVVFSEEHILKLHPSFQSLDAVKKSVSRPCYFELKLQDEAQTEQTLADLAKMSLEPGGAKLRPTKHRPWYSSKYQVDPTTLIITNIEPHMDEAHFLSLSPPPASVSLQTELLSPEEMMSLRTDMRVRRKKRFAHAHRRQAILIFGSVQDAQRALRNESMWQKLYEGQRKLVRLRRYRDKPECRKNSATGDEDTPTTTDAPTESATDDRSQDLSNTNEKCNITVTNELQVEDDSNSSKKSKSQENISLTESVIERTMDLCINSKIHSTKTANLNLSVSKNKIDSKYPKSSKIGTKSAMICKIDESKELSKISPLNKDNLLTKVTSIIKNAEFSPTSPNNETDLANEINSVQSSSKHCSHKSKEHSRSSPSKNSRRSKNIPPNTTYSVLKKECSDKKKSSVDSEQIKNSKKDRNSSILDTTKVDTSIISTLGTSHVKTVEGRQDSAGSDDKRTPKIQPLKKQNNKDITHESLSQSISSKALLSKSSDETIIIEETKSKNSESHDSVNKSTPPKQTLEKQNDKDKHDTLSQSISSRRLLSKPSDKTHKENKRKDLTGSVDKGIPPINPSEKQSDRVIAHAHMSNLNPHKELLCKYSDKNIANKETKRKDSELLGSFNKSIPPIQPLVKQNDEDMTDDTLSRTISSRILCKSKDMAITNEKNKRDVSPKVKSVVRENEVSPNAKLIGEKVQVEIRNFLESKEMSNTVSNELLPTGIKSTHKQLFKNREKSSDEKFENKSNHESNSKEHHNSRKSQKSSHIKSCKNKDKRCKKSGECKVLLERLPEKVIDYNLNVNKKYSDLVELDTRNKLEVRHVFNTMMKNLDSKNRSLVSDSKKSQAETCENPKEKNRIHKSQSENSKRNKNVKNNDNTKPKMPSNKNPSSIQIPIKNKCTETKVNKQTLSEKKKTNKCHKSNTDSKKKSSASVKMPSAKTSNQDGSKETRNCIEPSEMEKSELRLYSSSNPSTELINVTPEIRSNIKTIAKPNETLKKSSKKRPKNEEVLKVPKPYSKSDQKKKILNLLQNKKLKKSDGCLQKPEQCIVRNEDVKGTNKIINANKNQSNMFDRYTTQETVTDKRLMHIEEIENTPNSDTISNNNLSNRNNQSNLLDEVSVGDSNSKLITKQSGVSHVQKNGDTTLVIKPVLHEPNILRMPLDQISVGYNSMSHQTNPARNPLEQTRDGGNLLLPQPNSSTTPLDQINFGDSLLFLVPTSSEKLIDQIDNISDQEPVQLESTSKNISTNEETNDRVKLDMENFHIRTMGMDIFSDCDTTIDFPDTIDSCYSTSVSNTGGLVTHHSKLIDEVSIGDSSSIIIPTESRVYHSQRNQLDEISVGDAPLLGRPMMRHPNRIAMDEISVGDAPLVGTPMMRHPNRTAMDEISVGDAPLVGTPMMRHPNRTAMDEISVGDAPLVGTPMNRHPNRIAMDEISVGDAPLVGTPMMRHPNRTAMDEISVGDAPLVGTPMMRHPNRTAMDDISVGDATSVLHRNETSGSKKHVHTSKKTALDNFKSTVAEHGRFNIFGEPIDMNIENKNGMLKKAASHKSKNSHALDQIRTGEGESIPVTYRIGPVYQNHLGLDDDSSDSEEVHSKPHVKRSNQKRVLKKTNKVEHARSHHDQKVNSMAVNASVDLVQDDITENRQKDLTSKKFLGHSKHVSINGKTAMDNSQSDQRLLDEVSTGRSMVNWDSPEALPPRHPDERGTGTTTEAVVEMSGNRPESGSTLSGISNSFEGVSLFSRQTLSSITDLAMSAVSHSTLVVSTSSDVMNNHIRDENCQGTNEAGEKGGDTNQDPTRELNSEEFEFDSLPTIPQQGENSEPPRKIPNESAHQNPSFSLNDQESNPDIRPVAQTSVHPRPVTDEMSLDKSCDNARLAKSLTSFRDLIESNKEDTTQSGKTSIPLQVIQDSEYRNGKVLDEMSIMTSLTEIQGETSTKESSENDGICKPIIQEVSINTINMEQYREYRHVTQNDQDSMLGVSPIKNPSDRKNQSKEILINKTYRNPAPILNDQESVLGVPPGPLIHNDQDTVISSFPCVEDILEAKVNAHSKLIDTNTATKEQYTTYQTRSSNSIDVDSIISIFSSTKHKKTSKTKSEISGGHRTNKKVTTTSKKNGKKNKEKKQQKISDPKRPIENVESLLDIQAKDAELVPKSNLKIHIKSSSLQPIPLSDSHNFLLDTESPTPLKLFSDSSLKTVNTTPHTPLLKQTKDAQSCTKMDPNIHEQHQSDRNHQPLQESRDFSFETESPLSHKPLFDNPLKTATKDDLPPAKLPHENSEKPSECQKPLEKLQKHPLETESQSSHPPNPPETNSTPHESMFDIFTNTIIDDDATFPCEIFSMLNQDEWGKRSVLDEMEPPLVEEADRLEFFSKFDGDSNNSSQLRSTDNHDLILESSGPQESPEPLLDRDAIKCETPQSILDEDPDCPVYASSSVGNSSPLEALVDATDPADDPSAQENLRKSKSSEKSGRPVFNTNLSLYDLVEDNFNVEQNNRRKSNDNVSTFSSEDEHGLLNSRNKRRQRIRKSWDSTSGFDDDDGDKRKGVARQGNGWDSTSGFDYDDVVKEKRSLKIGNAQTILDPVTVNNRVFEECTRLYKSMMYKHGTVQRQKQCGLVKPKIEAPDKYRAFLSSSEDSDGDGLPDNLPRAAGNFDHFLPSFAGPARKLPASENRFGNNIASQWLTTHQDKLFKSSLDHAKPVQETLKQSTNARMSLARCREEQFSSKPKYPLNTMTIFSDSDDDELDNLPPIVPQLASTYSEVRRTINHFTTNVRRQAEPTAPDRSKFHWNFRDNGIIPSDDEDFTQPTPGALNVNPYARQTEDRFRVNSLHRTVIERQAQESHSVSKERTVSKINTYNQNCEQTAASKTRLTTMDIFSDSDDESELISKYPSQGYHPSLNKPVSNQSKVVNPRVFPGIDSLANGRPLLMERQQCSSFTSAEESTGNLFSSAHQSYPQRIAQTKAFPEKKNDRGFPSYKSSHPKLDIFSSEDEDEDFPPPATGSSWIFSVNDSAMGKQPFNRGQRITNIGGNTRHDPLCPPLKRPSDRSNVLEPPCKRSNVPESRQAAHASHRAIIAHTGTLYNKESNAKTSYDTTGMKTAHQPPSYESSMNHRLNSFSTNPSLQHSSFSPSQNTLHGPSSTQQSLHTNLLTSYHGATTDPAVSSNAGFNRFPTNPYKPPRAMYKPNGEPLELPIINEFISNENDLDLMSCTGNSSKGDINSDIYDDLGESASMVGSQMVT